MPKKYSQLFIDTGSGVSTGQAIRKEISGTEHQLEFDLSDYGDITTIRFDPANSMVMLKLERIEIFTATNTSHRVLPYSTNALHHKETFLIFDTNDPSIFIDGQEIVQPEKIVITLEYLAWGSETYKYISEEKSSLIESRDAELIQKDAELSRKDAELSQKIQLIQAMEKTFTWKVTTLLGAIMHCDFLTDSQYYAQETLTGKMLRLGARKLWPKRLILNSGLFDKNYYLENNPDVAEAGVEPLKHFIKHGGFEGRKPCAEFDSAYYLARYPEVKLVGMNPLIHYILYGEREGRKPHPGFNPGYSLENNSNLKASGLFPFSDDIMFGKKERRQPVPPCGTTRLSQHRKTNKPKLHSSLINKAKTLYCTLRVKEKDTENNDSPSVRTYVSGEVDMSVIIPTYNRASFIPTLLEAWREIDKVTRFTYEIIFSDDGSTDNTLSLLNNTKDLPLMLLTNEHGGPAKARNIAIRHARGKRLLIVGDDIIPNPYIINQHCGLSLQLDRKIAILGEIKWHPELDVNFLMTYITEIGNEQFGFNRLEPYSYPDFRHLYTSNISIDRAFLASEDLVFDDRFYKVNFEDAELGYRLSKRGMKIFYVPEAYVYHYHPYTVQQFCKRQETCGEMAVIFQKKHPETDQYFGTLGLQVILEHYSAFCSRQAKYKTSSGDHNHVNFDNIILKCEEHEIVLASSDLGDDEKKVLQINLSNIYQRLFRAFYELGALKCSFSDTPNISSYVLQKYFDWDCYWNTRFTIKESLGHYNAADKSYVLDQMIDQAKLSWAESQMSLFFHTHLQFVHYARLQPIQKVKRLLSILNSCRNTVRQQFNALLSTRADDVASAQKIFSGETKDSQYAVGILLPGTNTLTEPERQQLFSEFGERLCLIVQHTEQSFEVHSTQRPRIYPDMESVPVDFLYAPSGWEERVSSDHFRNMMLCLRWLQVDFVLVSYSLNKLPVIGISALRNQIVYSKQLGREFWNKTHLRATGKVVHLLPGHGDVREKELTTLFAGDNIRYDREHDYLSFGQKVNAVSVKARPDSGTLLPQFIKKKKLIFVWPVFMAVGGVERNTIEIMRQLRDKYHFVVITMEKHTTELGSLHHQLKGITTAVFDLAELTPQSQYLSILDNLKETYHPDLIWICNGSPWLCNHAKEIRRLFDDIPIVDQEVYDTNEGWINWYHGEGIQSFDRFIAINKKIETTFIQKFNMDEARIDLIYHAIEYSKFKTFREDKHNAKTYYEKFNLPSDKHLFLFVGRLHPQKRPFDFLKLALKRHVKDEQSFFVMVGDGPLVNDVDEFIETNNLTNFTRIRYIENIAEIFFLASGIIFTSEYEGLPLAMLEALVMEIPVLATDVGDIRLILEEYHAGMLFSTNGDSELYDRDFEIFLRSLPEFKKNLHSAADTMLERFSGKTVAAQYSLAWENAIHAKKRFSGRDRLRSSSHVANVDKTDATHYSWEGEDILLHKIMSDVIGKKEPGFFVDVGAHHPVNLSNTYLFYKKGWRGMNIDVMPGSMALFNELRPEDINLEIGIAEDRRTRTFYSFDDPVCNGFLSCEAVESHIKKGLKLLATQDINTCPLRDVLNEYLAKDTEIDFLSVDVEGLDEQVIRSNDFTKYRPKLIVFETFRSELSLDSVLWGGIKDFLITEEYCWFSSLHFSHIFIDLHVNQS